MSETAQPAGEFIYPPALSPGDKVAVLAPSSGMAYEFSHVFELGLQRLEDELSLKPVKYPSTNKSSDYLYQHPKGRAEEVMGAFTDPEIKGVMAAIGGADQLRILRYLKPEKLRDNPTRFFGISDNTNLILYLWKQGIVSFYGGQIMNHLATETEMYDYTAEYLQRALFEKELGSLRPAERYSDQDLDWHHPSNLEKEKEFEPNPGWDWWQATSDQQQIKERRVEGRVWGGCLEIIEWHLQTEKYLPAEDRLEGQVLALETSEELPDADYVKRMLMCMGERGLLRKFSAVLVGRPKARSVFDQRTEKERAKYKKRQKEVIKQQIGEYNPQALVIFNLDFGHTHPEAAIPLGGNVIIDGRDRTIIFSEPD